MDAGGGRVHATQDPPFSWSLYKKEHYPNWSSTEMRELYCAVIVDITCKILTMYFIRGYQRRGGIFPPGNKNPFCRSFWKGRGGGRTGNPKDSRLFSLKQFQFADETLRKMLSADPETCKLKALPFSSSPRHRQSMRVRDHPVWTKVQLQQWGGKIKFPAINCVIPCPLCVERFFATEVLDYLLWPNSNFTFRISSETYRKGRQSVIR